MNFCKDCKHASGDSADHLALKCNHERNGVQHTDMARYAVSGIEQPTAKALLATNCIVMRTYANHPMLGIEMCGPDGRWWEHKQ